MTKATESLHQFCPHCGRKVAVKDGRIQRHRIYGSVDYWYCQGGAK